MLLKSNLSLQSRLQQKNKEYANVTNYIRTSISDERCVYIPMHFYFICVYYLVFQRLLMEGVIIYVKFDDLYKTVKIRLRCKGHCGQKM